MNRTNNVGQGRTPVTTPMTMPEQGGAAQRREAAALLRDIQALCFAKTEATLYLDTHPDHKAALDYFYEVCDKLEALTEKYEAEYGPLTAGGVQGTSWHWIDEPWPWQNMPSGEGGNLNCQGNRREG